MLVRVQFNRNVLGYRAGTEARIEATPLVDQLVANGYLTWLDKPAVVESVAEEKQARKPRKPRVVEDDQVASQIDPEPAAFSPAVTPEDTWFLGADLTDDNG